MDQQLKSIFTPFKKLFIINTIVFILVFLLFLNLTSSYDKDLFKVEINGIQMKCYYEERFKIAGISVAGTGSYNSVLNSKNSIDLENSMNLNIKEFEVYYKSGNRKGNIIGWYINRELTYKEVSNPIRIEIKRMNELIYDGEYIQDISKYMNEKGRYYIHVYVNRKVSIIRNVVTHISFNVIVGDGNHD